MTKAVDAFKSVAIEHWPKLSVKMTPGAPVSLVYLAERWLLRVPSMLLMATIFCIIQYVFTCSGIFTVVVVF